MSRRAGKESLSRRRHVALAGLVMLALAAGPTVIAQDAPAALDPPRPGGRVIVKLRPDLAERVETALPLDALRLAGAIAEPDVESFLARHGIRSLSPVHPGRLHAKKQGRPSEPDLSTTYVVETSARATAALEQTLEELRQDPEVEFAEPDEVARISVVPTGPYDVRADVVVAVVDTGVDQADPDIAGRAWSNPNEVAGNGLDDDDNGYVDDLRGWDFVGGYFGSPTPDADPADVHGHGTRLARIVAAGAQVMAVKGLDDHGSGFDSSLAAAIVYAADNGAGVILNGWRGRGRSQAVAEAIQYASSLGAVVIAADAVTVAASSEAIAPPPAVPASAAAVTAVFDAERRAPRCLEIGHTCDSGTLLDGRAALGPEPNQPNAIRFSCVDGVAGLYHTDESNDRIRVFTLDGTPLAAGKTVTVEARVWAYQAYASDRLDLYYSANGTFPEWTLIATLTPTNPGLGVLTATYTLPEGTLYQAVRARFRYSGVAAPCGSGNFDDHDDLIFPVIPLHRPVANPGGPYVGAIGAPIFFSGLGSFDPDGDPLSYAWDFGDGATGSGPGPTHAYASAGTYTARLVVSAAGDTSEPADVSVTVTVGSDTVPPNVSLSYPTPGSHLSGSVIVSADAADNMAVARVEFYVDGVLTSTDTTAPWAAAWDTTLSADGAHTLRSRAYDPSGNFGDSTPVSVVVANGKAEYAAAYQAPFCGQPGPVCDSGTLLNGRGALGPEPNQPNAIGGSCVDSNLGLFHSDESNDRIRVFTVDGTPMASGKVVRVEATVWAFSDFASDKLDLYYTATVGTPAWTLIGTLTPAGAGAQVLSTTYTLPAGVVQAVRARFRYAGAASPCAASNYADHDDLVFAVDGNAPPLANPGGPYSGAPGQSIAFSGAGSSDPDGDALTYAWDFGDGTAGTGATPTHAYPAPGTYTATLLVNDGHADSAPVSTTVTVTNQTPVAHAGGPYTAPRGAPLTFNGTGTDGDGHALTYRWNFGDGSIGTGANASHTYSTVGSFSVTLIVNDGWADSAPATTTATVTNNRPIADAGGPYTGVRGVPVLFDGSGTDADGEALTYRWNFGDFTGTVVAGPRPTHVYTSLGTFTVTLIVSDGYLDSAPATAKVTIVNRPPVANPGGPYVQRRGVPVSFWGSGTDADGDPLTYRWVFGDGSTGIGPRPTHAYASFGTFTVTLTVNDGYVDSTPATTTAAIVNWPPIANPHGPYAGTHRVPVTFHGTGVDADGDALTYRWDFGDGTSAVGATVTHAYNVPGKFTVTLTANDGRVDSAPVQTTATITNQAPVANAGGFRTGVRRVPITFTGSGSDVNGDPLTYQWDFGDGTTGTGATTSHAYESLGTFTVRLTVNDGRVDSAPATTTARIDNRPPVANPGGPYAGVRGVPVTFNGSGTDADGDPLTYSWSFAYGNPGTGTGASVTQTYSKLGTLAVVLTVNDGYTSSPAVVTAVTISNRPPVANPGGPYSGHKGVPIAFNGGGTDADGDPLTYTWKFGDGGTATGASTTHSYLNLGTFIVTLTVSDGFGSASASRTATISNRPPTANPGGPYTGVRGVPIALSGSGTDADGDSLSYSWNFGDGSTGPGATPSHAYANLGTFTVTLTVSDGFGGSASASTTATISNRPPTANPGGPYAGVRGVPIALSGSGTDADGDSLSYSWNFGDGSTGPGATPSHAYANLGTFTVTLTVSDGFGGSASATTTATISNRPPTANPGGPYTGVRGVPITLSGSGTDADGDSLTYSWNFGDGSTGPGASASHAYGNLGTFTVTLTVSDGFGGSASATTTATISNRAPIANPGGPYTGVRGVPIALSGSGSDADGDALTYRWTFGDGANGTGASATHTYASLGTFTVTLIANDGHVDSASATTMVTIINLPPVANAGSDGRAGRNSLVILSGSGSDPDGSIVTYRWRQVSGPGVVLSGANTWQARFMAPSVFATTPLAFELTVTDNDGATASDEVVMTVCGNPKTCYDE